MKNLFWSGFFLIGSKRESFIDKWGLHKNRCIYTALCEVSSILNQNGISTNRFLLLYPAYFFDRNKQKRACGKTASPLFSIKMFISLTTFIKTFFKYKAAQNEYGIRKTRSISSVLGQVINNALIERCRVF